jgi:hypothetical protein
MMRELPILNEFITGFLAEGFSHRFKIERGLPHDAKIIAVRHEPGKTFLLIESAGWKSTDSALPLDIVIHELQN